MRVVHCQKPPPDVIAIVLTLLETRPVVSGMKTLVDQLSEFVVAIPGEKYFRSSIQTVPGVDQPSGMVIVEGTCDGLRVSCKRGPYIEHR